MSEPLRTCIGCRLRDNPRNMLRIVCFGGDGERMRILPDVHRTLPGRGAWLHMRESCQQQAFRKNAFARAFKVSIARADLMVLTEYFAQRKPETTGYE
ncbi:YlxR family protein [Rothia dentocariosa]|uniref:YlxR family protein n=1 Tax=Rothia dentocariosa TaxID=2047 RepID=UPI0009B9CECF|nr:YlxR family protein [Rothia dentocariosa]